MNNKLNKSPRELFDEDCKLEIEKQGRDPHLRKLSMEWLTAVNAGKYSYHFEWLGRPIIQYPQDIVAMQEVLWRVQPDLIIETGIAHGGSLVFYASMLQLIGKGELLGIDIDIRSHNRKDIEAHPMVGRINLIEGSSISDKIVRQVIKQAEGKRVLVILDSNHTHEHVLAELEAYAHLVSIGSYCVVMDTVIEYLPPDNFSDRPWGLGNNPMTAVREFISTHPEFRVDRRIDDKLLISVAPSGYLERIS